MKSQLLTALTLGLLLNPLHAADTNVAAAPAANPVAAPVTNAPYILTPPAPATPRINGANVFGVRPGSPLLYTIPATGDRPMTFSADNLPAGLKVDVNTGQITGTLETKGEFIVTLHAKNALGTADKQFRIVVGDQLALTPPMGWNSWNCFAQAVTADRVKSAADAMVKSGLINHGWAYINVDDFWQNHREPTSADLRGQFRDAKGNIVPNSRFPDMKGMADYIHGLGLKAGLYSSPGPWTCGGCAGSFGYEQQDAEIYSAWGFDYLKYDWCSYNPNMEDQRGTTNYPLSARNVVYAPANTQLEKLEQPYKLMGKLLRDQKRDIVFSLCQYGQGNVWQWGGFVEGNAWRITGDITDTWRSMSGNGFNKDRTAPYSKPGNWNDPDMLVVGQVGWGRTHPSRLTADEQYTHISLWCLLSAPLLIGCDMTKLDDFTLNLLENDEVLAIDQDALGKAATCVVTNGDVRVYMKDLEDGGRAIGFFNLGSAPMQMDFKQFSDIKLTGKYVVRDLWRQKDVTMVDTAKDALPLTIPTHGVMFYKLTAAK